MLRDWTDSLKLDAISAEAERLLVRLIMKADDYGRFHADSRLIKAACYPLIDNLRANDLDRSLAELSARQLILRYEADGRSCLAIVNYGQRLKSSKAKFPPLPGEPIDWLPTSGIFPQLPADSCGFREVPGSSGNRREVPARREGKGREGEVETEDEVETEENTPFIPQGGNGDTDANEMTKDNGRVLPDRWRNIPKQDRRNQKVLRNNRLMSRIGGWFGRKPETLWTLAEGIALMTINPAADEVDTLERYYGADIDRPEDYRRRDLLTLLNNWSSELDRARIWNAETEVQA